MIYNKIKFKNKDLIYDIIFLKVIKLNDVKDIKRVLKSKSFSLIINFDNYSKIDYFEIKLLSLSLSLSLFKKFIKIYKISKI